MQFQRALQYRLIKKFCRFHRHLQVFLFHKTHFMIFLVYVPEGEPIIADFIVTT